jgi:hypothetical protein
MLSGQETGIILNFHLYYNYAKTKLLQFAMRHRITLVNNV